MEANLILAVIAAIYISGQGVSSTSAPSTTSQTQTPSTTSSTTPTKVELYIGQNITNSSSYGYGVEKFHSSSASHVLLQMQGPEVGTSILRENNGVEMMYFISRRPSKKIIYNWMTMASGMLNDDIMQYGMEKVDYSSKLTCKRVDFSQVMSSVPTVHLTLIAHHLRHPDYFQASHAWLKNVTESHFTFCVHESIFFSGAHKATVNWFAVANSTYHGITERHRLSFANDTWKDGNSHCKVMKFDKRYSKKDDVKVFITTELRDGTPKAEVISWFDCLSDDYVKVCAEINHPAVTKDDIVINAIISGGATSNCSGVHVHEHLECKETPTGHTIGCKTSCDMCLPHSPICASDHGYYESKCVASRAMCDMYGTDMVQNITWEQPCNTKKGYLVGNEKLEPTKYRAATFTKYINFTEDTFHNYSHVLVLANVNRQNSDVTQSSLHDSASVWVEEVSTTGFRAYVRALDTDDTYINWVAYQKNVHTRTDGALVGGSTALPNFNGSICTDDIKDEEFASSSMKGDLVASLDHRNIEDKWRDSLSVWLEKNSTTSQTRACAIESVYSSKQHHGWYVNWLRAGEKSSKFDYNDVLSEGNRTRPVQEGPICKEFFFNETARTSFVTSTRTVSKTEYEQSTSHSALSSWIEGKSPMTACFDYSNPDEDTKLSSFGYLILDTVNQKINFG